MYRSARSNVYSNIIVGSRLIQQQTGSLDLVNEINFTVRLRANSMNTFMELNWYLKLTRTSEGGLRPVLLCAADTEDILTFLCSQIITDRLFVTFVCRIHDPLGVKGVHPICGEFVFQRLGPKTVKEGASIDGVKENIRGHFFISEIWSGVPGETPTTIVIPQKLRSKRCTVYLFSSGDAVGSTSAVF